MAVTSMTHDLIWRLSKEGRIWIASDADQNDTVTGQTSFSSVAPTFLLSVPSGTVCVPLFVTLGQTGSVAGGAIDVIVELDDADRYSAGGTAETAFNPNALVTRTRACTLYSGATASAGYGVRVWGATVGQDVSSAEGAVNVVSWKAEAPYYLTGPASLLVHTYAGTTGPTWFWTVSWAEFPTSAGL